MLEDSIFNTVRSDGDANKAGHIGCVVGNEVSESVKKTQSGVEAIVVKELLSIVNTINENAKEIQRIGIESMTKYELDEILELLKIFSLDKELIDKLRQIRFRYNKL